MAPHLRLLSALSARGGVCMHPATSDSWLCCLARRPALQWLLLSSLLPLSVRAFEVFSAYGLLLGQPSLCPTPHRPSWYLHLLRNNDTLLRYVTMVEIMVSNRG